MQLLLLQQQQLLLLQQQQLLPQQRRRHGQRWRGNERRGRAAVLLASGQRTFARDHASNMLLRERL